MFRKLLIANLFSVLMLTGISAQSQYRFLYKDLPFKMKVVQLPDIPRRQVQLTDFGGVGDGMFLNTIAFEKAINHLASRGGGRLNVPAGVWYTGPVVIKSNINLHLEKGAIILFSTDKSHYPLIRANFEGQETRRCQSPISARDAENIAITGEGSINGSGEVWRPLKKAKVTEAQWKKFVSSGGVLKSKDYWVPSESSLRGELIAENGWKSKEGGMTEADWISIHDYLRPVMVSLVNCRRILLQGVLFENSPGWNIHPLLCEDITVDGVFIRNPAYAQNGDGIDLESCKNAVVVNSVLDVGDDAICLKSGKDDEGRTRARPTENVIVDNCVVFKGHGGFVVGSEMSGGVRNVSVTNCNFIGTDVGLRFKSTRGRGGVVENIYISNISMLDIVNDSFLFDLYYGQNSPTDKTREPVADLTTPAFRNIYVKNIVSRNAGRAMFFNGLPEMNIANINVENSQFFCRLGAELSESDGVVFKNVYVNPVEGPALLMNNVKNYSEEGFTYPDNLSNPVVVKNEK